MTVAPERAMKGVALLFLSASIVGASGLRPEATSQAQVPVVSNDPAAQRQLELQLTDAASVRLAANTRIASLNLTARPLNESLDAIAKAGGITLRFASGTGGLDKPSTLSLSDQTVEDALRTALKGHTLTFQPIGPKVAFIYPDTPANRDKYSETIRVFPIAKADVNYLAQQLNRALKPTADGFRAMVLTVRDSKTLVVRAVPELMTSIAAWIAEHDKAPAP